jgi:uncharacterized membrane protein
MDFIYLGLLAGLAILTWGLITLCEQLRSRP